MNKTAEQIILVIDSSKFNQKAFSKVCDLGIEAFLADWEARENK